MKKYILLTTLAVSSLASCKKNHPDPPTPTQPAGLVLVKAFTPVTGTIAIKPYSSPPYTASGLQLQITAESTTDQAAIYYTWHGLTATGSGIEIIAKTYTKDVMTPGSGPWYAEVRTYTTAPDFTNPQGLDYAGTGILTLTAQGYTLPYTAQFIDGALTQ